MNSGQVLVQEPFLLKDTHSKSYLPALPRRRENCEICKTFHEGQGLNSRKEEIHGSVICRDSEDNASANDPLLQRLWSIKKELDGLTSSVDSVSQFETLLKDCILKFKDDNRYRNDVRFLKIWFLYVDAVEDFESVFKMMEDSRICLTYSLRYECSALFLESKGKLVDALEIYRMGISRNAEPLERLKKAEKLFISRMSAIVDACSLKEIDCRESVNPGKSSINPWSISTIKSLLMKMKKQILKYNGYHLSAKNYSGKVPLSSLQRNKIIELGNILNVLTISILLLVYFLFFHVSPCALFPIKNQGFPFCYWFIYFFPCLTLCFVSN
ncbi:mitotic checkpoint serine/threonine-protein kinase BUB1-like [Macadamia integrifolia]|uniref:mitotic checkpoint serine/threonine-protein kinase BUB1-like n=1 Tax=Macadamia integrifolia TaxID=60698 RepID=UPI001C4FE048|nr:mitotic checkpoint serine/threonine-protein kinase BUB1-like [Macadamia integrifolia]